MREISKKEKNLIIIITSMYILSFVSIANLNFLRYLSILIIHIVCLFKIDFSKIYIDKKLYLLLSILIISMIPSIIISNYIFDSISKIISIIDLIFMSNILLPNYLHDKNQFKVLEIVNNTIFVVLLVLFLLFMNDYSISHDINRVGSLIRLKAGFNHPNALATFSFVCLSYYLFKVLIHKFSKYDILKIIFIVFLIIKSGSRTALYVSIIFSASYLLMRIFNTKKRKLVFNFLIILLVMVIGFILIFNVYNISYDKINRILSYRLDYINNALSELIKNKLLFTGKGAFKNGSLRQLDGVLLDNGYFNYIYQFGIVSFIVFLLFIFRYYNYTYKKNDISIYARLIFISTLAYCFFENYLLNISSFMAIYCYTLVTISKLVSNNKEKGDFYE